MCEKGLISLQGLRVYPGGVNCGPHRCRNTPSPRFAIVFLTAYMKSRKVDEAIRIISGIIVSQEIEKAGKRHEYYDAVGPNAHEIIAKKGIEISKAVYYSYETFRAEGHFVVVAKALPRSRMKGKIIYESKTGKWVGTEDIGQEWLP